MYCAYVTRIHNLRKHTNADRLLCGECFGNTVIVDLGTDPDQLGVYFPTDGKLGLEFAQKNDLLRRKDENGAPAGGYLDPEKRNIKALKLRGEKSDGLFLPLSCLASFTDIKKLQEGDTISVLNGITICEKYVPAVKRASGSGGGGNHVRKRSDPISPLFQEHADTEQLAYNLSAFHAGDLVEVTLKMHGTSQRIIMAISALRTQQKQENECAKCSGIVYRQTDSGKIIPVGQQCGAKITPPCYVPDGDGCAYQIYGDNNDEPIDRCKSCPLCQSDKIRHKQESVHNDPLALDELRQMRGEPVWCKELECYGIVKMEKVGSWANELFLVGTWHNGDAAVNFEYDIKSRGLTLYRHKPEEGAV